MEECCLPARTNIRIDRLLLRSGRSAERDMSRLRPADEESHQTRRLHFMERYRKFLKTAAPIHVKTDSNSMFTYTKYMMRERLPVEFITDRPLPTRTGWMIFSHPHLLRDSSDVDRGLTIKYVKFRLPRWELQEPDVDRIGRVPQQPQAQ